MTLKTCLNCENKILNDNLFICNECYKLNLNTIYKNIKSKCPKNMTLPDLKNAVRIEKNSKFDNKIKCEVVIDADKKHIVEI